MENAHCEDFAFLQGTGYKFVVFREELKEN